MRIVFLRPKINITEPMPCPPYGIGTMASILRKNGHEVHFIDCAISKRLYSEIVRQVNDLHPDVIGITALTPYYSEMKKLSRMLHILKIPIILGGIHVSALPELSLRECGADFAIIGEGELTIVELMNLWQDKQKRKLIKGIAYIENNQFIMNPERELIENLDDLPMAAWDLINPLKYPVNDSYFKVKRLPVVGIFTTRGCPHCCSYCASSGFWKQKFRRRSPKNVVDEIEYLVKEFGIREVQIGDDYFNFNKNHVIEICREVLRRKLNLTFTCPNGLRIETMDKKLLTIMRKTGFYAITIAVESGSQALLNRIHKRLDLKKVPGAVDLARKLGFLLKGYFILGLPGETYETARRTIQLAKKLPYNSLVVFMAKPLPSSTWFDEWRQNKDPRELDYNWFEFVEVGKTLELSDGKRTMRLPKDAYRELYFRPTQIFRYLKYWVHTFHLVQSFLIPLRRLYDIFINL